jgi:hypothetical protein
MGKPDADWCDGPQSIERAVVRMGGRGARATLTLRWSACPLARRVDGLPCEDDRTGRRSDDERLMPWRVTRRGQQLDALEQFVIAIDQAVVEADGIDPVEDGVLGRVGNLPFGGLDEDRDAGE